MSGDGDLDGGSGGDGVLLGPGNVFTIGGAGGDGGESIFGMKSENKFLALANVLPLLLVSEGTAAAAAGGRYGTGLWGGNPRARVGGGARLLTLA